MAEKCYSRVRHFSFARILKGGGRCDPCRTPDVRRPSCGASTRAFSRCGNQWCRKARRCASKSRKSGPSFWRGRRIAVRRSAAAAEQPGGGRPSGSVRRECAACCVKIGATAAATTKVAKPRRHVAMRLLPLDALRHAQVESTRAIAQKSVANAAAHVKAACAFYGCRK